MTLPVSVSCSVVVVKGKVLAGEALCQEFPAEIQENDSSEEKAGEQEEESQTQG